MRRSSLTAAATGLIAVLAQGVAAKAAEVKIIAVPAMSAVIGEVGPLFERAMGHKLLVQWGVTGIMKKKIESGEPFDLAIGGAALIDEQIKQGKIAAGTRTGNRSRGPRRSYARECPEARHQFNQRVQDDPT